MIKIKRGQKSCAKCNAINGVRSFECKNCGAQFKMKKFKKKSKRLILNHKELNKGDMIRVVGGSGPYYIDDNGDRHYFVDRGKYTVIKTDDNGIYTYSDSGFNYLYMGETCKSNLLDSIIKSACKVLLIRSQAVS